MKTKTLKLFNRKINGNNKNQRFIEIVNKIRFHYYNKLSNVYFRWNGNGTLRSLYIFINLYCFVCNCFVSNVHISNDETNINCIHLFEEKIKITITRNRGQHL